MSGNYYNQRSEWLIGTSSTTATLTAAYSGNTETFTIGRMGQMEVYFTYTPAQNGRFLYWQVETGPSPSDLYKKPHTSSVAGTVTYTIYDNKFVGTTGGTTYKFSDAVPIAGKYCRISVKEDGVANFGTIKVKYTISGV